MDESSKPAPTYPLCPSTLYWAAYPFTLVLAGVLRIFAPRWRVSGRKNIPVRGPVILAPNHLSDADPPFLSTSTARPVWYMAKKELFEVPVLKHIMHFSQSFPVERGGERAGADRVALRRAEDLLKAGQAVVVFPEGKLSKDGELQELLPGVSLLALRAGVRIVPVGIAGTNAVVPHGAVTPRLTLKRIHIHFGEALDFSDLAHLPAREQRKLCVEQLETGMRDAIAIARG